MTNRTANIPQIISDLSKQDMKNQIKESYNNKNIVCSISIRLKNIKSMKKDSYLPYQNN
jgi:hypothetical protein